MARALLFFLPSSLLLFLFLFLSPLPPRPPSSSLVLPRLPSSSLVFPRPPSSSPLLQLTTAARVSSRPASSPSSSSTPQAGTDHFFIGEPRGTSSGWKTRRPRRSAWRLSGTPAREPPALARPFFPIARSGGQTTSTESGSGAPTSSSASRHLMESSSDPKKRTRRGGRGALVVSVVVVLVVVVVVVVAPVAPVAPVASVDLTTSCCHRRSC